MFGAAKEVAVVGCRTGKKAGNAIVWIGGKRSDADESFLLKKEDEKGNERGAVGALHRRGPLMGVEDFWRLFLLYESIPARLQYGVVWNCAMEDYAQGATPWRLKRCLSFS